VNNSLPIDHDLSRVIQAPVFSRPAITYLGSDELLHVLTPLFRQQIAQKKYDRMVIASQ
jgi:hypothetical protein